MTKIVDPLDNKNTEKNTEKKNGSDLIDDIFSKKKIKTKQVDEAVVEPTENTDTNKKKRTISTKDIKTTTTKKPKPPSTTQSNNTLVGTLDNTLDSLFKDSRGITRSSRRMTEDGLRILSQEEDLKIGLGGNSKECPFDCWCCF